MRELCDTWTLDSAEAGYAQVHDLDRLFAAIVVAESAGVGRVEGVGNTLPDVRADFAPGTGTRTSIDWPE